MRARDAATAPSNRALLLGLVGALALVIALGAVLGRRLLIFSPDDLVFQSDTAYTLDAATADSLAVFAEVAAVRADVNGHLLIGAMAAEVDGDVRESLTVFAETIHLGGDVAGDALLVGVDVSVAGDVAGDVVVFAESLTITGDNLGAVTACVEQMTAPDGLALRPCDRAAAETLLNRAGTRLAGVWLAARLRAGPGLGGLRHLSPLPPGLVLAGLGALAVVAFPRQVGRITLAVRTRPRHMALIGVLVTLLMIGLTAGMLVALSVTVLGGLVLLPFHLLAMVAFWVLFVGGWTVTSLLVGRWLAARVTDSMMPPVVLAAVGGGVLALGALLLTFIPVVGGALASAVGFVLVLAGLGASYTTRLGLRDVGG